MKKTFYFLLFVLITSIIGCISEEGLQSFSTLGGTVYDANTGKPISGIRVHTIPATNESITDTAGYFCLSNVAPGKYIIVTEKSSQEYIIRQVKNISIFQDRLINLDIPVAQRYVFVDAKPELDHNFYISAYEFKDGEFSGTLMDHMDEYKRYTQSIFMPYIIYDEAGVKYGGRDPLTQIFDYCNKKSIAEGLTPCYSGNKCDLKADGYRLPTYDEWVYAAKGGKKSKGFTYCGSNNPDDVAWYRLNSKGNFHLVGQKLPNELGLFDMSGNVEEITYISGDNLYDPSLIRYVGGAISSSEADLSYTKAKAGNASNITGMSFGCRLARTVK